MEVIPFLITLAIFCQNVITTKKSLQFSRLMFDLTRPLNELIAKEISQQDFSSDVNAAFNLIGANISTVTIFYATAGNTIEELETRTQDACNILHKALNIDLDTQLLLSWKFIGTTIDKLNFSLPDNQTFDSCMPKIVLDLNNDNGCDGIYPLSPKDKGKKRFASKNGMLAGVSYDESLHGCNSLYWWKEFSPIWIVSLKFGTTRGVTESFGLFQTRMKFLSETMEENRRKNPVIYYPNPYSVGKDEHQNLLIRYASIWTTSNKTRGSILLQVPSSRNNASEMIQFSIIPMFEQHIANFYYMDFTNEEILSKLWFAASFRRHQMVFVNEYVWELWNNLPKESIRHPKIRNIESTVDIPLNCGSFDCDKLNSISYQPSRLNTGNPTTFFIQMKYRGLPSVPPQIARRYTSKSVFGCIYYNGDFKKLSEANVEHVVKSCQSINGSVYILHTDIALEWNNELGKYSFYFENTIRRELHAVNRFRKGILKRAPTGKVYLRVWIQERRGSKVIPIDAESKSLFCDEFESTMNLYFEGIFNWAKLENFPIINSLYRYETKSYFSQWFSFLRHINYPYPEWALEEKRIDQMRSSFVNSPAFLMQDYHKSVHDWEPDACIDWKERRWEIPDDFFHNPKAGTTFHPNSILSNRSLTQDECITMLDFILGLGPYPAGPFARGGPFDRRTVIPRTT